MRRAAPFEHDSIVKYEDSCRLQDLEGRGYRGIVWPEDSRSAIRKGYGPPVLLGELS